MTFESLLSSQTFALSATLPLSMILEVSSLVGFARKLLRDNADIPFIRKSISAKFKTVSGKISDCNLFANVVLPTAGTPVSSTTLYVNWVRSRIFVAHKGDPNGDNDQRDCLREQLQRAEAELGY